MFKIDLLNYKTSSYILLFLSLLTILFDVTYLNQVLFVSILIFSILQNIMQYRFKTVVSSIVALTAIYLQFNLSENTFSKEFFLNLILILVFIKFSEIKKKQDHYFFNFTVIFLTISSLIYGQDFLSSINSFLLMLVSIIHLYSLNQKKILNINTKYLFKYLSISLLILPIMALVYFIFPRYEINIKIFDTQKNTLGIPETLKLGSFTGISDNDQTVFIYNNDQNKTSNNPLYFRVKIFDLMNNDKLWITTPHENIKLHYINTHKLLKNDNPSIKEAKILIYPNDKTWLPVLKSFDYENRTVKNNYLNGTAESIKKISKKKIYSIQSSKFSINYNKEFLKFYQKLPSSIFSQKLINWSNELKNNSSSNIDYLNNIMKHFANGEYYYTLSPTIDKTNDYEKFFFETKRGYCEYYAGMFAILARLQNIPTRIVAGYLGGEYNDKGNFYTFKQSDAHSWVEIYTDDNKWVRYDPTLVIPNKNILSFNNSSLQNIQSMEMDDDKEIDKLSMLKLYYDYFDYTWTNKFLNYDTKSRDNFLKTKIKNFELPKEVYVIIINSLLLLLLYKFLKLIFQRKLFFNLFFNKIKSQYNITNNSSTHQQLSKMLNNKETNSLREIFEIYEKFAFTKKHTLMLSEFFYFNYKIIKYRFFNKLN